MPETQPLDAPRSPDGRGDHPPKLVLVDGGHDPARGSRPVRVLIAYGEALARAGLEALLKAQPGIAVAGSAGDGEQAAALAAQLHPDVLLADVALPGLDAVEITRRLADDDRSASVHVLILGASESDEQVLATLRAGARGFLPRDTDPAHLAEAVRAVAAGEAALSPSLVRLLIAELASRPDPELPSPDLLDELTPREREVMALVATGLSNDEIAEHLVVSPATAKTHVSRALCKLHARDRAQLVTLAYESRLVLPRAPTAGLTAAALAAA